MRVFPTGNTVTYPSLEHAKSLPPGQRFQVAAEDGRLNAEISSATNHDSS